MLFSRIQHPILPKRAWLQTAAAQLASTAAWAEDAIDRMPATTGSSTTAMTDIHDIKPALSMGADLAWLLWVAGGLAMLALGVLAWWLWQRQRPSSAGAAAPAPAIPPEVVAFEELDALAAFAETDPKRFYFELSAVLRRYIESRYGFPAAEMTTEELLPRLDRLPLEPELAAPLKAFCREADPIKFAGAAAAMERRLKDLAFARDFIRRTTPEQPPAEQKPTEPSSRKPELSLSKTG
jgi:hypothetical protein